jgi:hypothetical protein
MAGFIQATFLKVKNNIRSIQQRQLTAAFAVFQLYAVLILNEFNQRQAGNEFWQNRTFQAMSAVFANAFKDQNSIGLFIAHGVDYGVYLELANDRRYEALRPLIKKYFPIVRAALQTLVAG